MDVQYDGQHALAAAANGDFPLVVLLWGMAMAAQPAPADLLALTDTDGNGILHYAAAAAVDSTDTLHFLLQQAQASGRDMLSFVDCRNAARETPLIRAAHAGNLRIVDALLNTGRANVLSKDAQGNTPAHHAAAQGHLWVLHFLLEYEKRTFAVKDAPLSTLGGKCNNKRDVLYYACLKEHKAIVQYLLKRGYDPNQPDADSATCLDLAQQKDAPWMVDLLSGEKSSSEEAPSSFRETRVTIALLYTGLIFAILSTSYFFPWWLAVPLILVVLTKSLAGFRHGGGGGGHSHGGGHGHGAPAKNPEALHPSKRDAIVAANVELTKTQASGRSPTGASSTSAFTIKSLLKPQPEMPMGIWLAWVSLFTLFHVALWVDSDYKSISSKYTAFLVVILVFHVIMVAIWLRLAFFCPSDPGIVTSYHDDIDQMLRDAADGIPLDIATYCRTCLVLKPMRSKHCAKCGVCIARLDHHCTWINRCVGYGNHRIFVIFLLLHTTVLFGYVSLAMIVIYEKIQDLYDIHVSLSGSSGSGSDSSTSSMDSMDVWTTVPAFISNYFLVVMVFVWGLLAFIALSLMTKQHLVNLAKNMTVNEEINWLRYAYLTKKTNGTSASGAKNVVFANPFDRGVKKNVKEFFSRSGKETVDYRKIFKAPSQRGFATVPEAHRAESQDIHFRGVEAV